jgi:hypothetical protein
MAWRGRAVAAVAAIRRRVAATLEVEVGSVLTMPLPAGQLGTIYIQRNGVDIPGAVSAPNSNYYLYTVVAEDAGQPLTVRMENGSLDTTPPRRHAIGIRIAAPNKIVITYNKVLSPLAIASAQFTLGGTTATAKTVTAAVVVDNTVEVTVSSNFVPGDAPTLAYTQSGTDSLRVKDWAGNLVPSFSAVRVFNEFPAPATAAALITTSSVCTVGGGGFVFSGTGSSAQCHQLTQSNFASATHQGVLLAGGGSGWVEAQVTDTNAAVRHIALKMDTSPGTSISEMDHAVRITGGTARPYADGVAVGSLYTFSTPSTLCRVRIFCDMPSGEIHFETSEDGAVNWTRRYTWTLVRDTEALMHAWVNNNSTTVACVGCALQGFSDRGF